MDSKIGLVLEHVWQRGRDLKTLMPSETIERELGSSVPSQSLTEPVAVGEEPMKSHRARSVCHGQTHLYMNSSSGGLIIISELLSPVALLAGALYNVCGTDLGRPVRRNRKWSMRHRNSISHSLWAVVLSCICVLGVTGCSSGSNENLTIITSSLPNGTVEQSYGAAVSGSGGLPPYTWSVTPALPANLTFHTQTGAITGTPAAVGTTSHTFTLQDSLSPPQAAQKTFTLTINPPPTPLSITTSSLPAGTVGQAYNQTVQAAGGTAPLTWSIVAGTLPQNLGLNPMTGMISGTPTAAGQSSFTVQVKDSGGPEQVVTQALSLTINPPTPPTITTSSPLPAGTVSQAYSQTLQASGGTGTLVWGVSAGAFPAS